MKNTEEAYLSCNGKTLNSVQASGIVDARLDLDRERRCGFPEVIFSLGKTPEQVARITKELSGRAHTVLATLADPEHFAVTQELVPDAIYHKEARLIVVRQKDYNPGKGTGHVVVATGGTADFPVAEEAAISAELHGAHVTRLYDIGVAGVHRALEHTETLQSARVIIAVAGMEGALPILMAGLVKVPVIAVPTSVGYGANFEGVAPLLTMLNSCSGGISVVNINNGFGAAVVATRINDPEWAKKDGEQSQ
ncbi:MAG: nickel pincer cofactor biosynthesis protein LarB [Coriobacteriia bacterium]|nr:nickel pincer cofactor biosynthesis protein LarB [Coriobacteriia bacterium]MCL2745613.1 nickel pincer cofactor biosynthesis protein LarB [Coriobacteriia bacterium]MCL2871308.1 nickel pincer cofactor biosynthesis protein LarB [Coriobacteriia bacterium]